MLSVSHADWARERRHAGKWEPGKALLKAIRDYQAVRKQSPRAKWAVLRHRFWSAVSGADIPLNCKIGGGLLLPHPAGVVIHPAARIGANCLLFQQVTIGSKGGVPILGCHVDVGAGAKLLGPIHIGDHAKIGANAVVVIDVPAGATAVGNPAHIVESDADKLCAATDEEARAIAVSRFGEAIVAKWGIYREESTDRIVVCRNFHVISGPEVIEYLDRIDFGDARAKESAPPSDFFGTSDATPLRSGRWRQESPDNIAREPRWALGRGVEAAPAARNLA